MANRRDCILDPKRGKIIRTLSEFMKEDHMATVEMKYHVVDYSYAIDRAKSDAAFKREVGIIHKFLKHSGLKKYINDDGVITLEGTYLVIHQDGSSVYGTTNAKDYMFDTLEDVVKAFNSKGMQVESITRFNLSALITEALLEGATWDELMGR